MFQLLGTSEGDAVGDSSKCLSYLVGLIYDTLATDVRGARRALSLFTPHALPDFEFEVADQLKGDDEIVLVRSSETIAGGIFTAIAGCRLPQA